MGSEVGKEDEEVELEEVVVIMVDSVAMNKEKMLWVVEPLTALIPCRSN